MDTVLLLLLIGLVALGLPQISHRDRQRPWHMWVNSGLVPFIVGMVFAGHLSSDITTVAQSLAAVALCAGGILLGTQLRLAYLFRAGRQFLCFHSFSALQAAVVIAGLTGFLAWLIAPELMFPLMWLTAGLSMLTNQRPPWRANTSDYSHRHMVSGHVAPTGWWNLIGLSMLAFGFGWFGNPALSQPRELVAFSLVLIPVPIVLGMVLAWLAIQARNRDEALLALLAILGLGAGLSLLFAVPPLASGLVIGCAFTNSALSRAPWIEQTIERLEQPIVVAAGFFAGLSLPIITDSQTRFNLIAVVLVLFSLGLRWLLRGHWSPSAPELMVTSERRLCGPGAPAVLVLASLALLPAWSAWIMPALIWVSLATASHAWLLWRFRRELVN